VFDEEVIERVREWWCEFKSAAPTRRDRRNHDELPLVAEKYIEIRATARCSYEKSKR
jgi:type I restriction enzyme M protein